MKKGKSTKSEDSNKRANLHTVLSNGLWVYKILFKMSPITMGILIITTLLIAASPTLTFYLLGVLIDEINKIPFGSIESFTQLVRETVLLKLIVGYTCILTLDRLVRYLESYLDDKVNLYYLKIFEIELLKKVSDLDTQRFEDPKSLNIIKKASDSMWRTYSFYRNSIKLASRVVSIAITSSIVFTISPLLLLITILLSIPYALSSSLMMKEVWDFTNKTTEDDRRSWWLSDRLNEKSNRSESFLTKSNDYIYSLLKEITLRVQSGLIKIYKKQFVRETILSTTVFLRFLLVPTYLILLMLKNIISVGKFTFFFQQTISLSDDLDTFLMRITNIRDTANYVTFIRQIYYMESVLKSGIRRVPKNTTPKIEFKNVWFKYPSNKNYVLKNINLVINPGDEIALVGDNGAGKTTLIKLILRFYDCDKGEILIDNVPIREYDLYSYYKSIGALFQDFDKFHELNVKQNIIAGNSKSTISIGKIERAAELADAKEFVQVLPQKYEQFLHKSFDKGTSISSGQWQKIALARMFYRNAPVLILDEPTASIDANAEFRIFKRIFETFKGKTLIIISHRFSTVRNAQKIYVIHNGEIVEEGTHEDLTKKNGRYKEAFDLQAKGYKE